MSCIGTSSLWYLDVLMNIWTSLLSTQNNGWVSKAFVVCKDSTCISSIPLYLRIQTSRYEKDIVKRLYKINLKGKIIQNIVKYQIISTSFWLWERFGSKGHNKAKVWSVCINRQLPSTGTVYAVHRKTWIDVYVWFSKESSQVLNSFLDKAPIELKKMWEYLMIFQMSECFIAKTAHVDRLFYVWHSG